ncbi:MAG TPA: hypothetical protein VMU56_08065 [Beijerinckiaceae bacterium]|nr:hypothetical protein [Beijerinckiaceae bacterium]
MSELQQGLAPPIGERMTRLEALFEASMFNQLRREHEAARRRRDEIDEQRRRDDHASEQRRDLARSMQSLHGRMEQMEPVILGDVTRGRKSIDERIKGIEDVILSASVSWRTIAFMATTFVGLASALAYGLHWVLAAAWPARAPHH